MPSFSKSSLAKLQTCHPDLQRVANAAILIVDFSVLCGHRYKELQNDAVLKGRSKLAWPNSKHNQAPSLAMDICPYPVDWNATKAFHALAEIILTISRELSVPIVWGGTWKNFPDLPHFELATIPPKASF